MKRDFSALQGEFDLLICGGGIYGAWTAYDAALRGLKVALVEQGDWAAATSSASSKLIHGGLRYLETFDFKLVKKALAERQRLLRIAPHRVWPLRFGVPVYDHSRNGLLKLKAGLTLYDALAGCPTEAMRHRRWDVGQFLDHFPFLVKRGLWGGYTYGDAQTDDARLVLELVAGAMAHGAVCVNYARVLAWDEAHGKVHGATVRDVAGGATVKVRAGQCVSTAGQWLAQHDELRNGCRLSKGVHLVLPALPTQEAILLTAREDGRVFFLIPWYGRTLLGTTDTDYRGDVNRVAVEKTDVDYLLAAANAYVQTQWTLQDVIASFAGLRVMQQSDAVHPSAASRDWALRTEANGLHHSVGGKITSAREDAAVIVDAVCVQLGAETVGTSGTCALPWAPQTDFAAWSQAATARALRLDIDAESTQWLLRRHGSRVERVFGIVAATPQHAARIMPDVPLIEADLLWCAQDEMVLHLSDLLRRRLPLKILARLDEPTLRRCAEMVAPQLHWDAARVEREVADCRV